MKYFKEKGIVHRDIKLDNLFFNETTGLITVGDVGSAIFIKNVDKHKTPIVGTRGHQGAEVFTGDLGTYCDIFSFGATLLHLLTGRFPYDECKTDREVQEKVQKYELPDSLCLITNNVLREMIESCLGKKS